MELPPFIDRLRKRLENEEGFTLIELLIVCSIVAILALIAIPSYLSFQENAHSRTAQLNVNSAIPVAVQYYTSHGGSYAGIKYSSLQGLAPGLSPGIKAGATADGSGYCIQATSGDVTYAYPSGAGGDNTLAAALCNSAYHAQ